MTTQIQEIFAYPIARDITTVITMDNLDLKEIRQELEEYVVTETIEDLIIRFLDRYADTRTEETNKIGVWISGFFGSGKSHFAKILGYLLENRQVGDESALDLFRLRIVDSPRRQEMEQLLYRISSFIDSKVISFQIKTEEELIVGDGSGDMSQQQASHISTIMYRQWLKSQGFSTTLWVGRLEQELLQLGHYDAFVRKVEENEGMPWIEIRQHDMLVRDAVAQALTGILPDRYPSVERALGAIDNLQRELRMGPALLASELSRWLDRQPSQEKTPHIVYIIDEMGQFVGESNDKLLELQSIAEAFASHGKGRLWLIVTAQAALVEVIEDAGRRENEFAKIRDRFDLRLPLTSENIETVLEERILRKKESQKPALQALYQRASGNIQTVCALQGIARPLPQPTRERFVADYPFPPYQLAILQQIFAAVRTRGGDIERIEGTERSLIGVSQAILKSPETGFAHSEIGRLVAFDEVYDQIQVELPAIDRRTVDEIGIPSDPDFLKRILKVLYLIQRLEWVPRTPANIARLLVSHVDDSQMPLVTLEQRVEAGLQALESGHYVVESGGQYEFLSGVKKDIELDIARVNVTANDRRREIKKYFRSLLDFGRLNYKGVRRFDISIRADDDSLHETGDIVLQIYSPVYSAVTDLTLDEVAANSIGDERALYWVTDPNEELYRELGRVIQTSAVVDRRLSARDASPEEQSALHQKQRDLEASKAKVESLLRQSLLRGHLVYNGRVMGIEGQTTQLSTIFSRHVSEVIPHVYTRFGPAAVRVNERSIEGILTAQEQRLVDIEPDLDLFDDEHRLNRHSPIVSEVLEELRLRQRAGEPRDGKSLSDFFEGVPYGWDPMLIRIVLAAMFRVGMITLRYEGREFHDYKSGRAQELLQRTQDFRRTDFVYAPQESLTPEERRQAQREIDRIFHRREPDAVNIMSSALEEELQELQRQNSEQRIRVNESGLPVHPILSEGSALIAGLLEQSQPDRRLKLLLDNTSELRTLKEYQEQLQQFVDAGHLADFRVAGALMRAVAQGQQVNSELDSPQTRQSLQEMEAIQDQKAVIERWGSYYRNMHDLRRHYQHVYEVLHQQRQDAYQQVIQDLDELHIPSGALASRLCPGPVGWNLDGLTCSSCDTPLQTLYYQIQSAPQERIRLIEAHTYDQEKVTQSIKLLRLRDIVKTRQICTVQDLDAVVDELRTAVQRELDAGNHVLIE